MTTLRFDHQRACASRALALDSGIVINCGCNDDPAHLKSLNAQRVVNCDLFDYDETMGRANATDVLFDCAKDAWPFDDGEAALVILGDILEHLKPDEMTHALAEARRVGRKLCVTVPRDERSSNCDEEADKHPRGAVHRTIVTDTMLKGLLEHTGWTVTSFREVEYDNGSMWGQRTVGYFVEAE